MSDTKLDPATLSAEERAIVDHEASRFHRDWSGEARYKSALSICEPHILAAAAPREQEIERLRARVVEVTAQRDAFMDSREEVVALRASLVQQAHDYRAQVVFWGENADQRTAEVASLRARVKELEGMVPRWCGVQGLDRLRALGWHVAVANWQDKPPMWLMVPPIPLPENTNNKEHND